MYHATKVIREQIPINNILGRNPKRGKRACTIFLWRNDLEVKVLDGGADVRAEAWRRRTLGPEEAHEGNKEATDEPWGEGFSLGKESDHWSFPPRRTSF
jgi:hypothetical protein